METITTIQYLTSLQGALRGTVAFCGFILFFVGQSKQSHAPAFKYLQYFIATLGVWGFFGCLFYFCPTPQLLPIISPFIYVSISFAGPIFMLFCVSYTMPKKDALLKKLSWILIIPCIVGTTLLLPPLQKFSITFTKNVIYIPYRDIREEYHFLFYVHIWCSYITILTGVFVIFFKAIRHPSDPTPGSRAAMWALAIFVGYNAFTTFWKKNNMFFWVPSIASASSMILLFLAMYYDTADQIIVKGRNRLLEILPFPVMILNNDNIFIHSNSKGKHLFSTIKNLPNQYVKKQEFLDYFTILDIEESQSKTITHTSRHVVQQTDTNNLFFLQEQVINSEYNKTKQGQVMMLLPLHTIQKLFSNLENKAFKDSLCNCYNQHYFQVKMKELVDPNLFPVSFLMCDIDNLKGINDKLGHDQGDVYIKLCYEVLRSSVRKDDAIFRLGGDEFLIILTKTQEPIARSIIQNIDAKMEQHKEFEPHKIGISVGVATATDTSVNLAECLKVADVDMYNTKRKHKEER